MLVCRVSVYVRVCVGGGEWGGWVGQGSFFELSWVPRGAFFSSGVTLPVSSHGLLIQLIVCQPKRPCLFLFYGIGLRGWRFVSPRCIQR